MVVDLEDVQWDAIHDGANVRRKIESKLITEMLHNYHSNHREKFNLCIRNLSKDQYDYLQLLGPLVSEPLPLTCVPSEGWREQQFVQSLPELISYLVGQSTDNEAKLLEDVATMTPKLVQ